MLGAYHQDSEAIAIKLISDPDEVYVVFTLVSALCVYFMLFVIGLS